MWVKRVTYSAMEREISQLRERVAQLVDRNRGLRSDILTIRAEREGIHEDLRKLLGLKPRTEAVAAAPSVVSEMGPGAANQHFQMKESPRATLLRLQREHDKRQVVDEQSQIMAAIKQYGDVLKQ